MIKQILNEHWKAEQNVKYSKMALQSAITDKRRDISNLLFDYDTKQQVLAEVKTRMPRTQTIEMFVYMKQNREVEEDGIARVYGQTRA